MIYGFLAVTSAIVAALSFFAKHKLRLTLLVVSPIIFFRMDFLLDLLSPGPHDFLLIAAVMALREIQRPLTFALIGWGLGLPARFALKRTTAAV